MRLPSTSSRVDELGKLLSRQSGLSLDERLDGETYAVDFIVPDGVEALPWEILPYEEGHPVGLSVPCQRRRLCRDQKRNKDYPKTLRGRGVFTEETSPDLPGLERERNSLQALQDPNTDIVYKEWQAGKGLDCLRERIELSDVVHFGGHANEKGEFQLHGGNGKWISLQELFTGLEAAPRFVWLNVCGQDSNLFTYPLNGGCPNALCSNTEIADRIAEKGVRSFYENLAAGMPIRDAVLDLRKLLWENNDQSWISCIAYGPGESIFKGG